MTALLPRTAVSVRYAVLIGVEESDGLPPCPFAADEVRALAGHLEGVGFAKSHQTLLIGPSATRSAAESRLRRLGTALQARRTSSGSCSPGPAFHEDGRGFLACTDTLADDRAATALAVADVFHLLSAAGADSPLPARRARPERRRAGRPVPRRRTARRADRERPEASRRTRPPVAGSGCNWSAMPLPARPRRRSTSAG